MARLSHIEDFEKDGAAEEGGTGRGRAAGSGRAAGREGVAAAGAAQGEAGNAAREDGRARARARAKAGAKDVPLSLETASDERDFHGLGEGGMSGGQKLIAAVSFVVLAAVVLYVLNYWLHFV